MTGQVATLAGGGRLLSSNRKGFTLAEVLVTLGIIGIVAAMTMPVLIANHKKSQTITQLKKAYTEINQAVRISESKFDTIDTWDFSEFDTVYERNKYFTDNYLLPNLKVVKTCDTYSKYDCWAEKIYNLDGMVVTRTFTDVTGKTFALVTASGYSVFYWVHAVGNGAWFWVDINGPLKRPNTIGKDIFPFIMSWGNAGEIPSVVDGTDCLKKLGVYPYGLHCKETLSREELLEDETYPCSKNTGKAMAGGFCGALIVYDGWQILNDYPW